MQDQDMALGPWRTYPKVQLEGRDGPPADVQVYEIIILGGGNDGRDHWGYPGKAPVKGPNLQINRKNPATWAPVNKDGQLVLQFQDSKSDWVTGMVRWKTGDVHGTAVFKVKLNDGHTLTQQ